MDNRTCSDVDCGWVGYPWFLRMLAILGVVMAVLECAGSLYFLWGTWTHFHSGDPGYQGWLLAPPLCAGLLLVAFVFSFFPRLARSAWVLIYSYRLSGETLEARDPVLRRRWMLKFSDVTRVRPFFLGGPRQAKAAFGWVVETRAGAGIPACEALPLWAQIASRCTHAEFVQLPKERLEQIMLRR